ncbi:hypothetical protein PTSG_06533 [Salpingoeca rosetta]|uniref:Peptide-N-glycosidase F N-terminal domain-containing protein n=1 Tax=Salpingoeca rosetta (strain ATCC 50818 / BSB-021) TaxID=946362 RepID=F2UG32_SALR5|nr:uncharacterized protein PTSG_06533 [Salpingoeca rosetta]EGD75460.1 hypothetical protein PTSG_06533 [Salpingoeca rosetta]|eukprot:XP_004991917.1 hypothetical protein PTSG_06533 [Salpingoeca rosetta]
MPADVQRYWQSHLFFAADPLSASASASGLRDVLVQWPYLQRQLTFTTTSASTTTTTTTATSSTTTAMGTAAATHITVRRLDGHFQFCNVVAWTNHSPTDPRQPYPPVPANVTLVANACAVHTLPDLRHHWAVVQPASNASCSLEAMARNVVNAANATAVIIMANKGQPLTQIGQNAFEQDNGIWNGNDNQGFCTMIDYNPQLLELLQHLQQQPEHHQQDATTTITGVQFTTRQASSSPFVAIDSRGRLQEIGALINPSLSTIVYAAQGLDYQARLHRRVSEFHLAIPLLTDVVGTSARSSVRIPSSRALSAFSHVELDARMTCRGTFDLDCDKWDHVHTVAMICDNDDQPSALSEANVSPHEIGRWITPYRRRVGRWLTPGTRLLARLDEASTCNVSLQATDNGSPWVFSLTLRAFATPSQDAEWMDAHGNLNGDDATKAAAAAAAAAGARTRTVATAATTTNTSRSQSRSSLSPPPPPSLRPFLDVPLFNSTIISTFDEHYNNRSTITITAPRAFATATIEALITGHGSMEFVPSRHSFIVNGIAFNVSFMDPLDKDGCAKHVWAGVEPNGHGAFEFGRDGWCNGWHVPPVVLDVTAAVNKQTATTIAYRAYQYDAHAEAWVEPHSPDGDMRLSSHIVFWK